MAELSSNDIRHLVADYEAQARRLSFELNQVKATIKSLKGALASVVEQEKVEQAAAAEVIAESRSLGEPKPRVRTKRKRGGGRRGGVKKAKAPTIAKTTAPDAKKEKAAAAKADAPKASKAKAKKKPAKKAAPRAYRPSEYDTYLFDALKQRGKATISSEFVAYIMDAKKAVGETPSEEEVFTMVARSLQKLANRRQELIKVPYEGRGKAYALPEWMRGSKLMAKHNR